MHFNGFPPVWSRVSPSNLMLRSSCHTVCTWKESLLSGSFHGFSCNIMNLLSHFVQCPFEWLLSRVGSLMFLQVASYWEALGTLMAFTLKASLLCWSSHVSSSCFTHRLSPFTRKGSHHHHMKSTAKWSTNIRTKVISNGHWACFCGLAAINLKFYLMLFQSKAIVQCDCLFSHFVTSSCEKRSCYMAAHALRAEVVPGERYQ